MPVETDEDMAAFFDATEFGSEWIAVIESVEIPFNGIYTDAPVTDTPGGSSLGIVSYQPRVITARASLDGIQQGDTVKRGEKEYRVNNIQFKDALIILFLHDVW